MFRWFHLGRLQHLSWAMAIAGILLVVVGKALDLGPLWPVTGMFLVVAGAVKVVVVQLWKVVGEMDPAVAPERVSTGEPKRRRPW